MPPNARKVDRTTKWGNPFRIGQIALHPLTMRSVHVANAEIAVTLFAAYLDTREGVALLDVARNELRGKDLACWCKPGNACHGDVLLRAIYEPAVRQAAYPFRVKCIDK